MKKILVTIIALALCLGVFTACGGEKNILVISRESGSGTRAAFEEILGYKESETYSGASIFKDTASVAATVENSLNAIGYVSLGALNDKVKAISIDGVNPSVQNVKSGQYLLQRPFLIFTKSGKAKSNATEDFLTFLNSSKAHDVIEGNSYILSGNAEEYNTEESSISGKISINGSTSMDSIMNKLIGEYGKLQPNVVFEKNSTGSSAGIKAVTDGTADIGMASRAFKSSETGLDSSTLCIDGIAVIVNNKNEISNISKDNLIKVYKGEIRKFSLIG